MQIKRRIKICYILSIIVLILNVIVFALDIYDNVAFVWKILDLLYVVTALIAVVGFGIFHYKSVEFAITQRKCFIFLVCASCISSLILGYIALLALFDINYAKLRKNSKQDTSIETTGEVIPTYDEIVAKIKQLDELKQQNLITEEEYKERKQAILDTIVKKS